ncbi:MAG: wyosine base formation [Acidimicrobiales bacterium]|nr:wyosine base formation [Acidimicrobiales bacterium]
MDVAEVCEDLLAERAGLLGAMGTLEVDLDAATPAEGWSVRDQLTHLAWFDEAATQLIVDPNAFRANRLPVPKLRSGSGSARSSSGTTMRPTS